MGSEPPLLDALNSLYQVSDKNEEFSKSSEHYNGAVKEYRLPVINLNRLNLSSEEQESCKQEIVNAAAKYGYFQVINHGIPEQVLKRLHHDQKRLFNLPFPMKSGDSFLNLPANSYRWGNPAATDVGKFMWSEAFHMGISDIPKVDDFNRSSFETFASGAANLSRRIAEILAQNLGVSSTSFFDKNFSSDSCYMRLNRYPPCPVSSKVIGFVPHTDSDFLTILLQDEVGGLQLFKEGEWCNVRPISDALVVSTGDLFEAWSNGEYKSVLHRVVAGVETERLSLAYFYCPSYETMIESCMSSEEKPPIYRKFSYGEYRRQIQLDVQSSGDKVGLPRFYQ